VRLTVVGGMEPESISEFQAGKLSSAEFYDEEILQAVRAGLAHGMADRWRQFLSRLEHRNLVN